MSATFAPALLDACPDALLLLDASGTVVYANPAAHQLGEMSAADQATLDRLCQPDCTLPAEPFVWTWQAPTQPPVRVEHRLSRLADGTLLVAARPLGERLSRAEFDAQRQLLESRTLLAAKTEAISVLAGGLAHDFNNLLTGVLGYVELLRQDSTGADARGHLDQIETLAGRAADLCQQLLAFAGRGRFYLEALSLNRVLELTLPLLQTALPATTRLDLELAADLPAVEADASQLRQLLVNLTLNASEALEERPGVVRLRTARADLTGDEGEWLGTPTGPCVILQVSDPGVGMSAAMLGKIFDPFFTTKFAGRGLGLSAVLGIVRGHRGGLRVESVVGHGTTFTVALPALAQVAPTSPSQAGKAPPAASLLIVDDDAALRNLIARVLDVAGYRYRVAESGQAALDLLAAELRPPLDLTMPDMSGEETLCHIHARWPALPVLLMSGYTEAAPVPGAVGFLGKPFRPAQLLERVREVLGERR